MSRRKPAKPLTHLARLRRIAEIIEAVDQRCMAADGDVTPTLREMTAEEMREIYRLANLPRRGKCRICGCTQFNACYPPCSWADRTQTLYTNPRCLRAAKREAKVQTSAKRRRRA